MSFINWKWVLTEELERVKKYYSEKTWALMSKVSSLEVKLNVVNEKIWLLEESSPWSSDKAQYDWDWLKKFLELQK